MTWIADLWLLWLASSVLPRFGSSFVNLSKQFGVSGIACLTFALGSGQPDVFAVFVMENRLDFRLEAVHYPDVPTGNVLVFLFYLAMVRTVIVLFKLALILG